MIKAKQTQPEKLTDTSLMPFGEHKGKRMIDVPESYLLFLWKNDIQPGNVRDYIEDNLDTIRKNQRR